MMDGSMGSGAASGAAAGTAIMPGWGTAIGAGIGLLGGMFSNSSARKEADKNRQFQQFMASHAHQIEAQDLEAAGLNRILTATGGAGAATPGGAVAQVTDVGASALGGASAGSKASLDQMLGKMQLENMKADANLKNSQTATNDALRDSEVQLRMGQNQLTNAQTNYSQEQFKNEVWRGKLMKEDLSVRSSAAAAAKTEQDIDESTLGRALRWIDRASRSIQGVGGSARSLRRATE